MKKHDEGYVLVFVLVVVTVLCLVALSIMSISLRNLQNQTASIQRMEEKYAAQGEAEKVVAQLERLSVKTEDQKIIDVLKTEIGKLCQLVKDETGDERISTDVSSTGSSDKSFTSKFTFVTTSGSVQITCEVELTGDIAETTKDGSCVYTITAEELTYLSYEIAEGEVSGG